MAHFLNNLEPIRYFISNPIYSNKPSYVCDPLGPPPELAVCNKLNSHQLNELIIIIINSFAHRSWIIPSYYAMIPRQCRVPKLMDLSANRYHVTLVPHPLVIQIPYIWYGQGVRPIWNPYESYSLLKFHGELLLSLSDPPWPRIFRNMTF